MKKTILVIALIALLLLGAVFITILTESASASLSNCAAVDKVCWNGNTVDGCTSWKYYCVEK